MANRVTKTLHTNLRNIIGKCINQIQLMLTLVECPDSDCDMESYNIDMSCIVSHISRLKHNKSAGHDGIVSEHVVVIVWLYTYVYYSMQC